MMSKTFKKGAIMNKRTGFTLAEVLITLGVIGVVAAMTLPTLIKEYQKHVWVNQLKKSVSTIENGFKMAMAEDEVDNLADTELFKSLNNSNYNGNSNNVVFENNLKKYFKFVTIENTSKPPYKTLNNPSAPPFGVSKEMIFTDGSSLVFFNNGPNGHFFANNNPVADLVIDVNSTSQKPNMYGRDVFLLNFSDKGNVNATFGHPQNCGTTSDGGFSCGSYLIQNGWKMDY